MENNTNTVTFNRVCNGQFEVLLNGAATDWNIVNGCMGASGRGNNIYCLYNSQTGKVVPVGSLSSAKKGIASTLTRKR